MAHRTAPLTQNSGWGGIHRYMDDGTRLNLNFLQLGRGGTLEVGWLRGVRGGGRGFRLVVG